MNSLRRPKASRGSGAQSRGAHDPARHAPVAHDPICQATGGPQPVAAGVSAPLMHGLSTGTGDSLYPPGWFTNFLQQNSFLNNPSASQLPENSHFVGATNSQHAVSPAVNVSMHTSFVGSADTELIDIDGDETPQPNRSEVRLNWTHKEDERLASAWLLCSKDPVDGNDKKSDQYWGDVTTTYNNTTVSNRTRNRNQLKIRWDRLKKSVSEFHGCWTRMDKVYASGMSDDQITDHAMELYASEHNDKTFVLQHVWKILRHERKWSAYVRKLEKEKEMEKQKNKRANPSSVLNIEDDASQRPVGHKKAKEERNGKKKTSDGISAISEKLEKFIEARQMAAKDREKMVDVQESLANKKLETAKLAHKTAREKTKCKMLEMYKELMFSSTSQLNEQVFGVAGSNNDINVLNQSDLFIEQLKGEGPKVQYNVNGREYNQGYYLADGIYPEWAVFVKSIRKPQSDKHKLYSEHQEGARKDVECAFGILQSRFCILRRPARLYEQGDLQNVMLACIILHNMIIEDEKGMEEIPIDLNEEASTSSVQSATITHGANPEMEEVLERNARIHDRSIYKQLQLDLIEHIWYKYGNSN